jgi:mannosylglycerate hydrolase
MDKKHLVIVPHTHWDREWYMPFERFRRRLVSMVDHLLEILEGDRKFTCFELDGQTIVLDDYLAIRPENRRRLEKLIDQGRILIGPWYVQPDEFLVSGESIIRNLRLGITMAKDYGKPSLVGYLPDQFGHIAQMPQIFAGFGIKSAVVWRGVGKTVNETQFLWEAPEGTQVFTIYLADSYGNGSFLPLKPKELSGRLSRLAERLQPFATIQSMLIMNGLDHLEPQDGLPKALEKAARKLDGMTAEIGSLATFIQQAKRQAHLPAVHYGEFRSPQRAPLLPGVTSARMSQKQRAFECSRLLEKYVEPLAAWATVCGDTRPYRNFVEHAWRLTLQNQPHDSICGCSVDKVHEEMESRFDRVEQVGKALQKDALAFLADQLESRNLPAENPILCIFNPISARSQLVDVKVELEEPDFVHSLRNEAGRTIAIQKKVGEREIFLQAEEAPEAIRQMVAGMESRELIGFYINNVFWRREGETLKLNLIMGRTPAGEIDFDERRKELIAALEDPELKNVEIRGISGAKTRIQFLADQLAPLGLTLYSLSHEQPEKPAENSLFASAQRLENEFYKIDINDDGTINILDKESVKQFNRCLQLTDEGDRGDTYNFDEVPGGRLVDAPLGPAAVSVVENGPAAAAVRMETVYAIPEKLSADRVSRTEAAVETPVSAVVKLYKGIKRIEFEISLENKSEDHRLRVLFNSPIITSEAVVESTFGVVRRTSSAEMGDGFFEKPIGTSPQKCFTCVEDDAGGMALFNRGIPEVEAVSAENGTQLALTLLRCVGWLSRDDLVARPAAAGPQFKTPGAQSKGRHVFEFAFTSYVGNFADAGIAQQAHAYAFPPMAAITGHHKGALKDGVSLVTSGNPNIVVSAIEPSRQKGAFLIRLYNCTSSNQESHVGFWNAAKSVYLVNFLEKKLSKEPLKMRAKWAMLSFRPAEIKTLQVHVK